MTMRQWWRAARIVASHINMNRAVNPDTEKYPMVTCKECGETDQATYSEPTRSNMVEQSLCFMCLFWTEKVDRKNDGVSFVYKGEHYIVGPEDAKGMKGYGGRQWAIYHKDGRTITTNLWHQGEVSGRFRDRLPDNCTIIQVPRNP